MNNEYGLDVQYFTLWIQRILGGAGFSRYKPHELARALARISRAADDKVLLEPEFSQQLIDRLETAESDNQTLRLSIRNNAIANAEMQQRLLDAANKCAELQDKLQATEASAEELGRLVELSGRVNRRLMTELNDALIKLDEMEKLRISNKKQIEILCEWSADYIEQLRQANKKIGALEDTKPIPAEQAQNDTTAFKNFHQQLCERFEYSHDDTDWRRDQASLIEHIAAQQSPAVAIPDGYDTKLIQDAAHLKRVIAEPPYCDHVRVVRHFADIRIKLLSAAPTPPSAEQEEWMTNGQGEITTQPIANFLNSNHIDYKAQRDELLEALKVALNDMTEALVEIFKASGITHISREMLLEKATADSPVGKVKAAIAKCDKPATI